MNQLGENGASTGCEEEVSVVSEVLPLSSTDFAVSVAESAVVVMASADVSDASAGVSW